MGKLLFNPDEQRVEEITETRPVDLADLDSDIAELEQKLVDKKAFRDRVQAVLAKNTQPAPAAPAAPMASAAPSPEPAPAAAPEAPAAAQAAPQPATPPADVIPPTPGM